MHGQCTGRLGVDAGIEPRIGPAQHQQGPSVVVGATVGIGDEHRLTGLDAFVQVAQVDRQPAEGVIGGAGPVFADGPAVVAGVGELRRGQGRKELDERGGGAGALHRCVLRRLVWWCPGPTPARRPGS